MTTALRAETVLIHSGDSRSAAESIRARTDFVWSDPTPEVFLDWEARSSAATPIRETARQRWFRMLAEAQQREIETAGIPDSAAEIAEARAIARGMAEGQLRSIRSL